MTKIAERLRGLLPYAVIAVAAVFATRRLDDFDTWWHLAAGRWIVENGRVPSTDTLSFTVPDHTWINLQWLFDVVLYGVHSLGGADGLVLLATVCFSLATWLLFANTRAFVGDIGAAILVLWALLLAEERFLIRPEMFSFIFLGLVLRVLLTLRTTDGKRAWWLVPIMALWVNFHALYVMGLVCIVCAAAGSVASRVVLLPSGWREASDIGADARRRLLTWAPAAIIATLANPFFLEGLRFPLKLMTRIEGERAVFSSIGEFRSPWSGYFTTTSISAYQGLFIFGVVVVIGAALIDAFGRRRREGETMTTPGFDMGAVAIFCGLAYLSYLARRNMGIFAFGVPPVLAMCLSGMWARIRPRTRSNIEGYTIWFAPLIVVLSIAMALFAGSNRYYQNDERTHEFGLGVLRANYPRDAISFAREMKLPGPMYNDLTMGGYMTWDHPTDEGVFMDGRLEVYDTTFYGYYQAAFRERGVFAEQVEKYGIQTAVLFHRWGNRHALIRLMMGDPRWTLVYHDWVAVIFVRREGNEDVLARALAEFPKRRSAVLRMLAEPDPEIGPGQVPVSRLVELETYTRLLSTLGRGVDNIELYENMLALGPPDTQEQRIRFSLGYQLARRGDTAQALRHLEKSLELDPGNERVIDLIQKLGG
jgi:hypothetical protein